MTSVRPAARPDLPVAGVAAYLRERGLLTGGRDAESGQAIHGLTLNSRAVQPGDLFVAPPGGRAHGASYAADAVHAGAAALLTDAEGAVSAAGLALPVLVVDSPRAVVGDLAAYLYDHPAAALRMIGVTGTQGKTTVSRLVAAALETAGIPAGVVGTVGTRIAGEDVPSLLTTPEAPELQALFAVMRERGVTTCAMEVSSHALVMGRVDGTVFDVACFLNLGRDHLDFHADVEDYYRAKASLFTPERARGAVINLDDPHGRRLADETSLPVVGFAVAQAGRPVPDGATWVARDLAPTAAGSTFVLDTPHGTVEASVALPGAYNVSNAVCAVAALVEAGHALAEVVPALARVSGVPGRMEAVDAGQDFLAVVDYAHKPDAVEAVLTTLRQQTGGRIVLVLGAGGDRDRGKRPLMGEIAGRLADLVVVTDDNPRSEDPAAIRAEVLAGVRRGTARAVEEGDRRRAIVAAVAEAGSGDVVVVAGKGHETGQEVAGVVTPFDDRVELRAALDALQERA